MVPSAFIQTPSVLTIAVSKPWAATKLSSVSCKSPLILAPMPRRSMTRSVPRSQIDDEGMSNLESLKPDSTRIPESEVFDADSGSVVVRPTFYLAAAFLGVGGLLCYIGEGYLVSGLPLTTIGIFLWVQTLRIRFVFGPKKISVANRSFKGEISVIRGWEYEQITNWEVWWPRLPILAYFKVG